MATGVQARYVDYAARNDALAVNGKSVRGKDIAKMKIEWEERIPYHTFDNGWTFEIVKTKNDLDIEGKLVGHCAGHETHVKDVGKRNHLFFSLREPSGVPHGTFFCINVKYKESPYWRARGFHRTGDYYYLEYGKSRAEYAKPFEFEGQMYVLSDFTGKSGNRNYNKYYDLAKEFYTALGGVIPDDVAQYIPRNGY